MKTKNLLLFIALFTFGGIVFTACEEDPDLLPDPPTITFKGGGTYTSSDASVAAGSAITAGITASDADKIESFKLTIEYSSNPGNPFTMDSVVNSKTFDYDITRTTQAVAGTETWTFSVTNKEGRTANVSFTITTTNPNGAIDTYSSVIYGSQNSATLGSFYSTSTNMVYLLAQAAANSADVDFCYYDGAANMSTIGAPTNTDVQSVYAPVSSWPTKNATMFNLEAAITAAAFDAMTDDADISTLSPAADDVKMLAANDVVSFETAAGKKGLLKVVAIDRGAENIEVEVKVQQ